MGLLDEAFERTTADLSGKAVDLPRHMRSVWVPPNTCAPGVFIDAEGEERGFWLTLRTLALGKEMAILNTALSAKKKTVNAGAAKDMVKASIFLFHEDKPVTAGGEDAGVELNRARKDWLWNCLGQRGRNYISDEYGKLTEVEVEDDEGND